MSLRYLVPCECGKALPVATSQAGGRVRCDCGAEIEIPRLRDLRELPAAGNDRKSSSGWSFRLGVLTAGVLLSLALAAGAGWFAATEPEPTAPHRSEIHLSNVNHGLEQMPPKRLWELLVLMYEPLTNNGFEVEKSPQDFSREIAISRSQWYQEKLLMAAGVAFCLAVVGFAVSPKS